MNFFGNFGSGPGRPSWSPLGRNTGSFGNRGTMAGGNPGPVGSGITHGLLPRVTQQSLTSTLLNMGIGIPGHGVTSSAMATLEPLYPKVEVGASIMPPCMAASHVEIPRPLPMRELGERLPFSVPSMGMKPEVAVAPAPVAPAVMPAAEKSIAPRPVPEVAKSVSTDRTIEAAAPKQSLKERVFHAFSGLGDFVAGEEPIILPTGKDYLMGDHIQRESAAMEGKVAATAALSIPPIRKGYAIGKLVVEGAKAVAEAITPGGPGGLTLATPNGAIVTGALEAVPAAVGVTEGTGVGTVTTAITGSDLPLSMSLKQEKTPGQREVGNTGSYKDLKDGKGTGGFQDDKEVHHIVLQRYLKKHDIPTEDAPAVVFPKEMHEQTSTYKGKAKDFDLDQTFRDATVEGVKDVIKIEKEHGIYESGGRKKLIDIIKKDKKLNPELYQKGPKK